MAPTSYIRTTLPPDRSRRPTVPLTVVRKNWAGHDAYNAAVKEHAETAIRVEPGVLVLYVAAAQQIGGFRSEVDVTDYSARQLWALLI
jgi:hypothetical protein